MACVPPYFGYCCEAPVRDERVVATAGAVGFISADRSELQQLYAAAEYFVIWNFTTGGTTYSGSHSILGIFDEGQTIPRYLDVGDAYPAFGWPVMDRILTSVSPTVIEGTLRGRTSDEEDADIRDIATFRYTVDGAIKPAHVAAIEAALAYNPQTNPSPAGVVVSQLNLLPDIAQAVGNTFRPTPAAFPRLFVGDRRFAGSLAAVVLDYRQVAGSAVRLILGPDAANNVRLRPYTRTEFDTSPVTYLDCVTVDGAGGADVLPTVLGDGLVSTHIEVSKWPKTGPSPC